MNVLIWGAAFAGFVGVSLSMERHARQLVARVPAPGYRLLASTLGWGLLAFSLAVSLRQYGASVGVTAWLGFLAMAATCLGLLLSYRPAAIRYVAPGVLILGAAIAGLG